MIKHIIATIAFMCTASYAAPPTSVGYADYPRVFIIRPANHTTTSDGVIMVCMPPNEGNYDTCKGKNSTNAWQRAEDVVPKGFKLSGYEYRAASGSSLPLLILYFTPLK